jgi:hypothetical protein
MHYFRRSTPTHSHTYTQTHSVTHPVSFFVISRHSLLQVRPKSPTSPTKEPYITSRHSPRALSDLKAGGNNNSNNKNTNSNNSNTNSNNSNTNSNINSRNRRISKQGAALAASLLSDFFLFETLGAALSRTCRGLGESPAS